MLNKSRNEVAKTIGIEVRAPIHYHVITTHYKQWCLCSMQRATSDTCAIISLQSNLQPNRMMNKIVESSPHFRHLHKYLIDLILVVFHLLHHGFVDPDNMHPLQDIVAKNDTQLPCGRQLLPSPKLFSCRPTWSHFKFSTVELFWPMKSTQRGRLLSEEF